MVGGASSQVALRAGLTVYTMQVSRYVLNFLHKLLRSPLNNLFTASRTV